MIHIFPKMETSLPDLTPLEFIISGPNSIPFPKPAYKLLQSKHFFLELLHNFQLHVSFISASKIIKTECIDFMSKLPSSTKLSQWDGEVFPAFYHCSTISLLTWNFVRSEWLDFTDSSTTKLFFPRFPLKPILF